jgi:diguanylate cyclase (GGDEF)-like protein
MFLILISTNAALAVWVILQRLQIKQLHLCSSYGCLTRQGVDAQWQRHKNKSNQSLIFLDLDKIHDLNEKWGYTVVDAKIKASLKCRKNELLGRWYSGDELIIIVPTQEALATCNRIQNQLENNGLSGTFAIVPINKNNKHISDAVKKASALVQSAKLNDNRKVIINWDKSYVD